MGKELIGDIAKSTEIPDLWEKYYDYETYLQYKEKGYSDRPWSTSPIARLYDAIYGYYKGRAMKQARGLHPGSFIGGYIGGELSLFNTKRASESPGSQGSQTANIGGAVSPFNIKRASESPGSQGGQAANIGGAFSPFNIKGARRGPGGAAANAVVHVAGGKYTFNVDKLDGPKLKQILLQVRREVRPNG